MNNSVKSISDLQKSVDEWIINVGKGYFSPLTNLGILMEEVGEMSRILVRTYGEQTFKESDRKIQLEDEMADVLWVLLALANQTGIDLEKAFEKNIAKKTERDSDRHQQRNV